MSNARFRADKILARSLKNARQKIAEFKPPATTIMAEAVVDMEAWKRKHAAITEEITNLLFLFNFDMIDYVRSAGRGRYAPVDLPKGSDFLRAGATHRLVATSWNTEPTRSMPKGSYALSVCAEPLAIRTKQTAIKVRSPFPDDAPAYKANGPIYGKQAVLLALLIAMRASVAKRIIPRLGHEECDLLYQNLIRASRQLKFRRLFR